MSFEFYIRQCLVNWT